MAIKTKSGLTHLLFFHEVGEYGANWFEFYHTYEQETGNWSIPRNVFSSRVDTIFNVTLTERGFILYYYDEGIEKRGARYREYNEQSNY